MASLEEMVEARFNVINVGRKKRDYIHVCLDAIKQKHEGTYLHSARVGLLCDDIALSIGFERETLFAAGLVHDIGKIMVSNELLDKTTGFDAHDFDEMKKHTLYGHFLLCNDFPYIAEIVLRHHRFGKNPYPPKLPRTGLRFSVKERSRIVRYAMALAAADCYDAMMTRHNDHECCMVQTPEEKKEVFIAQNKKLQPIISVLYEKGVLGRELK